MFRTNGSLQCILMLLCLVSFLKKKVKLLNYDVHYFYPLCLFIKSLYSSIICKLVLDWLNLLIISWWRTSKDLSHQVQGTLYTTKFAVDYLIVDYMLQRNTVRIKQVEFKENVRALFSWGQSKFMVQNNEVFMLSVCP